MFTDIQQIINSFILQGSGQSIAKINNYFDNVIILVNKQREKCIEEVDTLLASRCAKSHDRLESIEEIKREIKAAVIEREQSKKLDTNKFIQVYVGKKCIHMYIILFPTFPLF